MINAADSGYADLRVWQDADGDGVTDAGELKSLSQRGIASISLSNVAPATPIMIGGNSVSRVGSFTRSEGSIAANDNQKSAWRKAIFCFAKQMETGRRCRDDICRAHCSHFVFCVTIVFTANDNVLILKRAA